MTIVHEVDAGKLNAKVAQELKGKMQMPQWALIVKTGTGRERPPSDPNWFFIRAASILRRIYIDGPVGTNRLRSYYGSKNRKGHKPTHFAKAGGKIIRTILKDLEALNLIEKAEKPKKGRKISKQGRQFMDAIAKQLQ